MRKPKPVILKLTPLQTQYLYSTLNQIVVETATELETGEHKLLLVDEIYFTKQEIRTTKQILKKIKGAFNE